MERSGIQIRDVMVEHDVQHFATEMQSVLLISPFRGHKMKEQLQYFNANLVMVLNQCPSIMLHVNLPPIILGHVRVRVRRIVLSWGTKVVCHTGVHCCQVWIMVM